MKLVYINEDGERGHDVEVGDICHLSDGEKVEVTYFAKPHKPSSSGKVSVKALYQPWTAEYFVSVINAEWVDREDRPQEVGDEITIGSHNIKLRSYGVESVGIGSNKFARIEFDGKEYNVILQGMINIWAFTARPELTRQEAADFDSYLNLATA